MSGPIELARPGFSPVAAAAVVVANMIGTGVFTSLGFQLLDIESGFVLLSLWVIGGMVAICGALTYAELGAALPRSGGEYNFLSRIYHPSVGFVSGWLSATIGFAAPVALAAISFGSYFSAVYPGLNIRWLAVLLVIVLSVVHSTNRRSSAGLQTWLTGLKILLILMFSCLALFMVPVAQPIEFLPLEGDGVLIVSSAYAVSLIYVNYAYSGWNAATYLTGEVVDPQRTIPRVLLGGTFVVMLLYVLLNFVFLYVTPIDLMRGQIEIGHIASLAVFGSDGGSLMGVVLSLLLISTVSAMIIAGPRVLQMIGQDFSLFASLSRVNADDIPVTAILFQMTLSLIFIVTSSFEFILVFAGFTMGISSLMTVAGIYVLRFREPQLDRPYRTAFYPLTPLVYLIISCWTLGYILIERPLEALSGIAIIVAGFLFYALTRIHHSHPVS